MLRKSLHIAIIAVVLIFWEACSTQKNTFLTRTYHNTTSHFNGYFWGKLAYQEGLQKLQDNHKEDYSEVLPVFMYADDKEAQSIYPEMDRAIKKATTMIENHTITDKQKREIADAVKYIKYCYLLLAKARIYKNEYLTAIQALDYASKEYKKSSVKYEAIMWEARAYNQIGAVSKSEELIDILKSTNSIPKNLYPGVCATIADYYSRTGQNDEVIKWLNKAVAIEKDKVLRARYYFILAQMAQKAGDMQNAFKLYSNVLKMHPPYDMDFEATINRALLFMGNDKENQNIKKTLVKMLKQAKNSDNKDQIYYALAQIAEKEGDTTQAVTYLVKSVRASTINMRQKAVSYLALADIDFNHTDYINAKKYYDSTLFSLPKDYKGRDSIVSKRDNLQKLVRYLDIINLEDSVLKLSRMPQKELYQYIDKLIEKAKEEAAEKKREQEIAAENQNNASNDNGNNPASNPGNGKWYFYNPAQVQMGENEFAQKWGNRPLEDDWRRSKKISQVQEMSSAGGNNGDTIKTKGVTAGGTNDSLNNIYSRAYYLKNIPRNDTQVHAANDSLVEAFYNAGSIYKEYLRNDGKASGDFEELLKRYPDNKYKLTVYYQLYRIYYEMGNTEKMNYYKNILLTKYPNTEYAQLIANPEKYHQSIKASKEEMTKLYVATLQLYQAQKYPDVLANCQKADSLYPKNPYEPKFAFLAAVATGATQGLDAYKKALTRITILYPKDSVRILAQSTLEYLNKKNVPAVKDTGIVYSLASDSVYYWIATIDNKEASQINNFRITLTDLNSRTFSQDKLQMDNLLLNPNEQMILVRTFKTAEAAKNYYGYMHANTNVFKTLPPGTYQTFYISGKNFHIMFNHRKADEYLKFFKDKGL